MIKDTSVQNFIANKLKRDNDKREADHEPSKKLSASALFQPLRFQVLKTIGVPKKPFDAYSLSLFKRGRDVENWYVSELKEMEVLIDNVQKLKTLGLKVHSDCDHKWEFVDVPNGGGSGNLCVKCHAVEDEELLGERQPKATYRNAIGYIDAVVNHANMQFKGGIIPHEIKSVKNAKLSRIKKTGIDWHYKIQACFPALAMGVDHYAVDIVSAEDYQVDVNIFQTRFMKREVDNTISAYDKAMETWENNRILPKFEPNPNVKWTANRQYAMFEEEWIDGSDKDTIAMIEKLGLI